MYKIYYLFIGLSFFSICGTAQSEIELLSDGLVLPRLTSAEAGSPLLGKLYYGIQDSSINLGTGFNWLKIQSPFQKMGTTIIPQVPASNLLIGLETIPIIGLPITGNTLLYYQNAGAFRGGMLENSAAFDIDSLGDHSFAFGKNVHAHGRGAVSFGLANRADGNYSIALGSENEIRNSGSVSVALGSDNLVLGGSSAVAIGNNCAVLGSNGSMALGLEATTDGSAGSVAIGYNVTSSGDKGALAMGANNICFADSGAAVLGYDLINSVNNSVVVGRFNDVSGLPLDATPMTEDARLFSVGNGDVDNRSNALVVLKKGSVGIGTNEPSAQMQLETNSSEDYPHLVLKESNTIDASRLQFQNTNIDSNFWAVAARPKKDVNNATAYMNFYYSGLAQNVLRLTGDGNAEFSGDVTASCGVLSCSDRRYKTNILPIGSLAEKIMKLDGVYFNWKQNSFLHKAFGPERQIGIIAQDLEREFPELVHTDSDGYKTVAYDRLAPILLEVVKMHQTELEKAQEANRELQNRIGWIEQKQKQLLKQIDELREEVLIDK